LRWINVKTRSRFNVRRLFAADYTATEGVETMTFSRRLWLGLLALVASMIGNLLASAQQPAQHTFIRVTTSAGCS
jgi:hypothetical protein